MATRQVVHGPFCGVCYALEDKCLCDGPASRAVCPRCKGVLDQSQGPGYLAFICNCRQTYVLYNFQEG